MESVGVRVLVRVAVGVGAGVIKVSLSVFLAGVGHNFDQLPIAFGETSESARRREREDHLR